MRTFKNTKSLFKLNFDITFFETFFLNINRLGRKRNSNCLLKEGARDERPESEFLHTAEKVIKDQSKKKFKKLDFGAFTKFTEKKIRMIWKKQNDFPEVMKILRAGGIMRKKKKNFILDFSCKSRERKTRKVNKSWKYKQLKIKIYSQSWKKCSQKRRIESTTQHKQNEFLFWNYWTLWAKYKISRQRRNSLAWLIPFISRTLF